MCEAHCYGGQQKQFLPFCLSGKNTNIFKTQIFCEKMTVIHLWQITSQRLLDESHVGPYTGENATYPPFWAFLELFAYPTSRG